MPRDKFLGFSKKEKKQKHDEEKTSRCSLVLAGVMLFTW